MKAGIVESTGKVAFKDISVPVLIPGKALIKVHFGGLCGPTDDAILKGLHPRAKFPLVLCHEFSGEIADIGENESGFKKGDHVVINPLIYCNKCEVCRDGNQYICENLKLVGIDCDGGFAEYCLVPEGNLVKLPDLIPMDIAALSEPMAVGVHSVKESGFQIGDTALIFGAGPIGLFVAEACRYSGAKKIVIIDIDKKRLELAGSLGYEVTDNAAGLSGIYSKRFDFVFETTGSEKVLKAAVKSVKIKGSIIIVGKFDFDVPFDFHAVLFDELTIKGMRVYRENEFLTAVEILSKDPERYKKFISNYFKIEEIEKVFETFKNKTNLSRIMVTFR